MQQPFERQTADQPLFGDMLWSRPENRAFAGKLLIVGGNVFGFSSVANSYGAAMQAGIGTAQIVLPDALGKNVAPLFPEAIFTASTPSGSFATQSLGELLPRAEYSDGVLFSGDMGRNSETAILLERFMQKYDGQITLGRNAVDYAITQPTLVTGRSNTLLVLGFSQLQKLIAGLQAPYAFTADLDMFRTSELLQRLTTDYAPHIITRHLDSFFVAVEGRVSVTPCPTDDRTWRTKVAAGAATWWAQQPGKPFEAFSTSLVA